MSKQLAVARSSPNFPKYLALDRHVFFVMPDSSNPKADPEGLWNAGVAQITCLCDKKNDQGRHVVPFKELKSVTVRSESYPGREVTEDGSKGADRGPFELLPEYIVAVYEDSNDEENKDGK